MNRTLDIADPLLREAEEKAARDGTTLLALVEQGLQTVLKLPEEPKPYRLVIKPFHGTGVRPGYENLTRDKINEIAYEDEDRFR